jgi:hypothetical protein
MEVTFIGIFIETVVRSKRNFTASDGKESMPMFTIAGYTITDTLHEGANSLIYRGIRADTKQPMIVLKIPRADYPTPQHIRQFAREYQFIRWKMC